MAWSAAAVVAIDGSFFHGDASKASIFTRKRLAEQIAKLDLEIEAYGKSLEDNDAAEAKAQDRTDGPGNGGADDGSDIGARVAALMAKRSRAQADLDRLEASGETQLSLTDPDARLLVKSGQGVAGYNVQAVVDDKHKLIVASEVVNDSSDVGQLHAMAKAAKRPSTPRRCRCWPTRAITAALELKACEDDGITAYVPVPGSGRPRSKVASASRTSRYDAVADAYTCPASKQLHPMEGRWQNTSGRIEIRYASRWKTCRTCRLSARCLSPKASRRTIARWEHEDVLERHRVRMQDAGALMRRRSAIVEHPFGTLKCRAGYRHFLVRGFDKVRGEWSLMALCYNFTRVLNILGLRGLCRLHGKGIPIALSRSTGPCRLSPAPSPAFWANIPVRLPIRRFGLSPSDDQHYLPSLVGLLCRKPACFAIVIPGHSETSAAGPNWSLFQPVARVTTHALSGYFRKPRKHRL